LSAKEEQLASGKVLDYGTWIKLQNVIQICGSTLNALDTLVILQNYVKKVSVFCSKRKFLGNREKMFFPELYSTKFQFTSLIKNQAA